MNHIADSRLDASIVQPALPTTEHEFTAQLCIVGWVTIAYPLAFGSTLPIFARLAEIARLRPQSRGLNAEHSMPRSNRASGQTRRIASIGRSVDRSEQQLFG